jgi:hypothetical protein
MGPLTTKEIAVRMLQETGIPEPDTKQVRNLIGAVNRSLGHHIGKSVGGRVKARLFDGYCPLHPRCDIIQTAPMAGAGQVWVRLIFGWVLIGAAVVAGDLRPTRAHMGPRRSYNRV